jgi:hypothetical protein
LTTGKALLIGGGVLAGGYILYQLIAPKTAARPSGPAASFNSGSSFVSGLVSLLGGVNAATPSGGTGVGSGGSFWTSAAERDANGNNPYLISTPTGGYSAGAAANYGYADSHPGTALPDGVYGPPVPATGLVEPQAGDFTSGETQYA